MESVQDIPQNKLYKKGLHLEYFTVGYNIVEAVLSILFGSLAKSIALVGFGLDSIVESLSGMILIWRLRQHGKISEEEEERIEKGAQKFVAMTFFILGLYVLFQSVKKLIFKEIPDPSLPGIIIAAVSLIVMPILSYQKYKTGKQIQSEALIADSKEIQGRIDTNFYQICYDRYRNFYLILRREGMKKNMGSADRIIRTILAIVVAILYFTDQISGTAAIILGILAIIFLLTSFIGFCPLYLPFRISTRKKE
jgi:divalent metal cation (Fe/Co/Zn/Cd) transporter